MSITPPELEDDGGTVRSKTFNDIYFSPDDGMAETNHVFIDGNDLLPRFAQLGKGKRLVIGELGFGTGLNFIAAWAAFDAAGCEGSLDFWSCEAHPLPKEQFAEITRRIGERWPELALYADRLGEAYPEPRPGLVKVWLNAKVSLSIAFQDVGTALKAPEFQANAWFLD
ncbi:MAG: MnmC family methyltransferase, partial [Pseudomonadota bacterium]